MEMVLGDFPTNWLFRLQWFSLVFVNIFFDMYIAVSDVEVEGVDKNLDGCVAVVAVLWIYRNVPGNISAMEIGNCTGVYGVYIVRILILQIISTFV
jgi:hypothetical protein